MISGTLLFNLIVIPVAFMLGRLSTRIAFVRVKQNRASVGEFMRGRDEKY